MKKLKKRNLQRLASLSAVGAGAVFMTADKAEAVTIYWSGPMNVQVGWTTNGVQGTHSHSFGAGNGFRIGFSSSTSPRTTRSARQVNAYGEGNLRFARGANHILQLFSPGAVWGTAQTGMALLINERIWSVTFGSTPGSSNTFHRIAGNGSFTHQYALFEFNPGTGPLYGWVELSGSVTDAYGSSNSYGPSVTLEGWLTTPPGRRSMPAIRARHRSRARSR